MLAYHSWGMHLHLKHHKSVIYVWLLPCWSERVNIIHLSVSVFYLPQGLFSAIIQNVILALAFCQGGSRAMLTSMMANEKHILPAALYWPSLLITLPTMAQLITCQACLVEGISFLIWKPGAPKRRRKMEGKKQDSTYKTTEHELSHNVKVRKSNLTCEITIYYSTMTTGSNHGRPLQWDSQLILQSDRHDQHKMVRLFAFRSTNTL